MLTLTSVLTVAEVVGGLITVSLALLADAGHTLSDDFSLGLALFAAWLAGKPATPNRSFGYRRAEILAALANGVTLVAISIWIFVEAYGRLREPSEVLGGPMLAVATLGLLAEIGTSMARTEGVAEIHDLHVWTITSGFPALAAHVLVGEDEDCHAHRRALEGLLSREYGIEHITLQVDHVGDHAGTLQSLRLRPSSE